MKSPPIFAPDDEGKRVVESEWWSDFQTKARGILTPDSVVDFSRITHGRLFQNGRQRRTGVFGVKVDPAGQDSLVADISPGQIEAALNLEAGLGFEVLRQKFAEDDLLREVLGANHDSVFSRGAAGAQESHKCKEDWVTHFVRVVTSYR